MATRLSQKIITGLELPARGSRITYDDEIKGFGVRATAAGAKSFVINYRVGGRERRYTIGQYPAWSVAAAREEAKELRRRIDRGDDPMGARHASRAAPAVADLCDRYVDEHLPKKRPSSRRHDISMIAAYVRPKLGKMKVAAVGFADCDGLHRALKDRPYAANRVAALLSKMFNLSIRWGMRPDNPAKGIERYPEERREPELSGQDRARLLVAMQEHAAINKTQRQTVNAIRLAMLSGCRIGEALSARWADVDLEREIWVKPSARTKQKKVHRIPLNPPALQLLTEIQQGAKEGATWLFPSPKSDGPQTDYKHSWAAIRAAADLPRLRVHDLRHAFASEGATVGLSLPMIGALLGHASPATTARYAHLFDDPLRAATRKIGARLTATPKSAKKSRGAG